MSRRVVNDRRPESPQAASLRERAEKVFREMLDSSLEDLDVLSPETLRACLHERRIRQILINLLANAVKFTSDGSVSLRVTISGQGAWASLRAVGSPKPEAHPCEAPVSAAMPVSKRAGRPILLT